MRDAGAGEFAVRRIPFIMIGLLALAVCLTPISARAATSDDLFNTAVQSYVAGNLEQARLYLEQVLQQNPGHQRAKQLYEEVTKDLKFGEAGQASPPVKVDPPPADQTAAPRDQAVEKPAETPPMETAKPQEQKKTEPTMVIEEVVVSDAPAAEKSKEKPVAAAAPSPILRYGSEKPPDADEPGVYGIEVLGDAAAPEIFIKTTEGVDFLANPITSPPSLVIDLIGAADRLPKKPFDVKRGPIVRIRHSQSRTFPILTARITVELKKGAESPVVEARPGGIWVRFGGPAGGPSVPAAPVGTTDTAPAAAAAPVIEIGPAYSFVDIAGAGQRVGVARSAQPLEVKVIDAASGQAVIDLPVTFELVQGEGSFSASAADATRKLTVRTDKTGKAAAGLAAGRKIETYSVKISAGDAAKFNLIEMVLPVLVTAGAPIHIEKISGDLQEAITGEELKQPLVVRVTDEFGNPVQTAKVQFSILKGNGRLDTIKQNDPRDNESVSDSSGLAVCEVWVLGVEPGEQLVEALLIGIAGTGENVLFSAKASQRIVSLDFKDAVVVDVIRTLAQLGNMNVIFDLEYDDAKKKFVVPFIDPKGVEKKSEIPPLTIHVVDVTVLEALDMVLESSGLTRVVEGNAVRIIAKQRALGRPLPIVSDTPARGGKFVTHVFKLQFTDAENMQKLLGEFVERDGGQIIADPLTNQLLVTQTADNIKKVSDVVALLDISTARAKETNMEVRSFKVKNVSAVEMAEQLSNILSGPGFEFTLIGSDLGIKKKGTVVHRTFTLKKRTKSGKDTLEEDFIKQTLTLNIMTVNAATNSLTVLSTREILSVVGQVLESLDVKTEYSDVGIQEFNINYMDMAEAETLVKQYLSDKGKYKIHKDISMILINDRRDVIQKIEGALAALDRGVKELAIYRIKYLNTIRLRDILNRFMPSVSSAAGTPAADEVTRSWWVLDEINGNVIIFDAPGKIETVTKLLEKIDSPEAFIQTITLKHLSPSRATQILRDMLNLNVAREFQKTFPYFFEDLSNRPPPSAAVGAQTNLAAMKIIYPIENAGTILVIADPGLISAIETLIAQIDLPIPPGTDIEYIDITDLSAFIGSGDRTYTPVGSAFGSIREQGRPALKGEVEEMVKQALSPSGSFFITGFGGRFYLLVRDMPEKIGDLKILFQKMAKMPAMEYRVYRMKYARVFDVTNVLAAFVTDITEGGEGVNNRIYALVSVLPASNAFLVMAPKDNFDKLDRLVERLDIQYAAPTQFVVKTYILKNIPVEEAVRILSILFIPNVTPSAGQFGGMVGKVETIERNNMVAISTLPANIPLIDEVIANIDVIAPPPPDMMTEVFYLNNAKPSDISTILRSVLNQSRPGPAELGLFAEFAPDDRLNALTVIAPPSVMKIIADLVRKLDQRAPQVLIDATILEYTLEDLNQRGINFITQPELLRDAAGAILNPLDIDALTKAAGKLGTEFAPPLLADESSKSGAYRIILNTGQMRIAMEALMRSGKVEVLATPKITALNNKGALISAGRTVFVPVTTFNASGQPATRLEQINALLRLSVTPTISNDRSVNLHVELTDDAFTPSVQQTGAQFEQTNRAATTDVLLGDNQTLVLGGVIRDRRVIQQSAVPFLKDIPVLGNLFKSKREQSEKTELMIFITPRVITNLPEATQVTKDVAKSLQQITPFPVNINTSSVAEIAELSGLRSDVDPEQHFRLSQRIVARREQFGPYQSLEQLLTVPGLTRVIFDDIVYRIEYKVDVNVVSLQELVRIKGITLGMAQKIVEERKMRSIFRSEDEFEALMLGLGMNKGFYDRFLKPIIIIQNATVGTLSLAAPQEQRLPVAPQGQFTQPSTGPDAAAPRYQATPTPTRAPTPTPVYGTPASRPTQTPVYTPAPQPTTAAPPERYTPPEPEPRPAPSKPATISPPPAPTQKKSAEPIYLPPAPRGRTTLTAPPPAPKIVPAAQPAIVPAPEPQVVTPPTAVEEPQPSPAEPAQPPAEVKKPYDATLPPPDLKPSVTTDVKPEEQGKMDINTAALDDLMKLPGIDKYRAHMIDAYRYTYGKFKTISDLKQVPDISEEIYDQIKDKIYVAP